jgi:hypothetical protein
MFDHRELVRAKFGLRRDEFGELLKNRVLDRALLLNLVGAHQSGTVSDISEPDGLKT